MTNFGFNPVTGLSDTNTFPQKPGATAARQQFMTLFNQIRDWINQTLLNGNGTITADNAATGSMLAAGWTLSALTFTYASATTITVPGDQTGTYYQGIKLMFTNGGTVKYFLVDSAAYSSLNTTITIRPFDGSALANSAITLFYSSIAFAPAGFPLNPPLLNPSLTNGWAQISGGEPTRYYKDALGRVYISGAVKSGTGNPALTLPSGYRPLGSVELAAIDGSTGAAVGAAISNTGALSFYNYVTANGVQFNGSYLAEQ